MGSIPDQGDDESNRILREIIESDERDEGRNRPSRIQAHGNGRPLGLPLCTKVAEENAADAVPCWPLLNHPYQTLTDRSRWPNHLCPMVQRESLTRWIAGEWGQTSPLIKYLWLTNNMPVPVGEGSMLQWAERFAGADAWHFFQSLGRLPFDGDEYAGLILTATIRDIRVTMFEVLSEISEFRFQIEGIRFTVEREGRRHKEIDLFQTCAREWWAYRSGGTLDHPHAGGRPKGSGKLLSNKSKVQALYRKWRRERGSKFEPLPLTVQGFALFADVSPDTVYRRIKDGTLPPLPWKPPK